MVNLNNAIDEAIRAIDQTTTLFYQQKSQEGYQQLDSTLNILMQAINLIMINKTENEISIDEGKLNTVLGQAMTAMEQGDTILLSDLLIFELKDMLANCYYR